MVWRVRRSTSTNTPKATRRWPKSTSSSRATRAANTPAAKTITIVGAKGNPAEQDAEIVNQTLKNLGFTTKFTLVETATMYAKYCNVPKEEIDVCPSVGWIADFARPADGAQHHVQRQVHQRHGQRQLGPDEHPEAQRRDDRRRIGDGHAGAGHARGRRSTKNSSKTPRTIPFDWDKQANIEGSAVGGVGDLWDVGEWDYSWTSLK